MISAKKVRVEIGIIPKKKEKDIIYFSTFEEMNKILSAKRIELLNTIKEQKPESIYELANMLNRDQGNVTKDVNLLEKHGFLQINKQKEGKRSKSEPVFDSEGIEMIIKMGAGAFGVAKDVLNNIADEFKNEDLEKNKTFTKQKLKKVINPVKKTVDKLFNSLDD